MAQRKTFTPFQDQVNLLQHDKNIVISDVTMAEDTLKQIGYWHAISFIVILTDINR